MSKHARIVGQADTRPRGTSSTLADRYERVRAALETRNPWLEVHRPGAVSLVARGVARAGEILQGKATAFRGRRTPEKWRMVVRLELPWTLEDVAYLATSDSPIAREAARAIVSEYVHELYDAPLEDELRQLRVRVKHLETALEVAKRMPDRGVFLRREGGGR